MIYNLLTPSEIMLEIGKNLRLIRVGLGIRQEDLSRLSGASLQAIKNLENGGNVEFITFIRVTKALGLGSSIWDACQPQAQTLDEIERIEAARTQHSRVRIRSRVRGSKYG